MAEPRLPDGAVPGRAGRAPAGGRAPAATAAVALGASHGGRRPWPRSAGLLAGPLGLALLLLLLARRPDGPDAEPARPAHRCGIAVGVVPVFYLVDLPSPGPAAIVMAALAGGLVGYVAVARARRRHGEPWRWFARTCAGRGFRARPRRSAAAGALLPWLAVLRRHAGALAALAARLGPLGALRHDGDDPRARRLGGPPCRWRDPDWKFADYPQGHHALVATLMDAVAPAPGTPSQEIVLYVHAQALALILAVTILAAAVCTVGWLRSRPMVALPAVALAVVPLVAGPGGVALRRRASSTSSPPWRSWPCVPLVARELGHGLTPLPLAALTGLLVAVAHDWVLLLAIGLPAALVAVPQLVGSRARRVASRARGCRPRSSPPEQAGRCTWASCSTRSAPAALVDPDPGPRRGDQGAHRGRPRAPSRPPSPLRGRTARLAIGPGPAWPWSASSACSR